MIGYFIKGKDKNKSRSQWVELKRDGAYFTSRIINASFFESREDAEKMANDLSFFNSDIIFSVIER